LSDHGNGEAAGQFVVQCSPNRLRQSPAAMAIHMAKRAGPNESKFGEKVCKLPGHVNGGKSLPAMSSGTKDADKAMEDCYGQLWDFTQVLHPPSATRVSPPAFVAPPLLVWIRRDLAEGRCFTIEDASPPRSETTS
jgi:hypothetical protein